LRAALHGVTRLVAWRSDLREFKEGRKAAPRRRRPKPDLVRFRAETASVGPDLVRFRAETADLL
jgi:hypothetical protein